MNRNEFNRFIVGIGLPGPADIEGLRELTTLFPWFHSAHLLLLKGLKENSDIRFDSQLKASALSVSDREVLYHYIYLSPGGETAAEVTDEVSVATETVEQPAAEAVVEEPAAELTAEVTAEESFGVETGEEPEETAPGEEAAGEVTAEEYVAAETYEEPVAEVTAEEPAEEMTEAEAEAVQDADATVAEEEAVSEGIRDADTEFTDEKEVTEGIQDADAELPEGEAVSELIEEAVTEEPPHTEEVTDHEPAAEVIPEPEVTPEEEVVPEAVAAAGLNTGLRSREELVAEIEARLRELEIITREQITRVEAEYSAGEVDTAPIPADEPETGARGVEDAEEDLQPAAEAETEYETVTGPVHDELLELLPDDTFTEKEPEKETVKELTPADLIDRFISISPTIERIKPGEVLPVRDLSETGNEEEASFITETLAKIYVNQGYYTKAINIYQKLSLQYPEKSAYFAGRIEKIEELIK